MQGLCTKLIWIGQSAICIFSMKPRGYHILAILIICHHSLVQKHYAPMRLTTFKTHHAYKLS
jgi:hypothetical protein